MPTIPSEEIIRRVRKEYDGRTLISFSTGKDALAAYIAIRDHFDVVPFYLYLVPDLEFVEDSLSYYEKVMGRRIIRLPHPSLYRWLNNYLFQPPGRHKVIEAAQLPNFDYVFQQERVCEIEGLDPEKVLSATGVRAADSPHRRMALEKYGAINRKGRVWYPVWDWNKERLLAAIDKSGIKLPIDYEVFGRTFDGLDLRFLYPMKRYLPRDYKRVLEWFPLADMEIYRYERSLR
jgi:hypothetical protein